jgi:DNA-binding beta-propeller fold protein YncE
MTWCMSDCYASVFTSNGQFVTTFAPGPGEFECPSGLAVDSSGVVCVCDRVNNRVHVFQFSTHDHIKYCSI